MLELENALIDNPRMGDPYGKNIYKVRVADESKGKGKSGGFRIVTYVINETRESTSIYIITILYKSEEDTIDKNKILKLVKKCGLLQKNTTAENSNPQFYLYTCKNLSTSI